MFIQNIMFNIRKDTKKKGIEFLSFFFYILLKLYLL